MDGPHPYPIRNRKFLSRFPPEFLTDVVAALVRLYPETFDATRELPLAFARYLRPHELRTRAEMEFLAAAQKHGVPASTRLNRSLDAHNLVAKPPFVGTLSRLPYGSAVPRRAQFRQMYATYHSMAQFGLPGIFDGPEPLQIDEAPVPEYVIFGHGSAFPHGRDIEFVVVNFVGADGRYVGQGIDLLREFGIVTPAASEEEVDEKLEIVPHVNHPEEAANEE